MRILHVNKFLYRRGGAEAYMHEVATLQRAQGDEVEFFGEQHPDNEPFTYAAHFPPLVEFDRPMHGVTERAKALGRMLYSTSARRGMEAVLDTFEPDVVHLHNIYHGLSPSILQPIATRDVPAVMTLHDYKLACPTYRFLDHGRVCEACLGKHFHQAALHRCKDGSFLASAAGSLELGLHTLTHAYGPVARFICPSHFLAAKMEQAGVYPDRLRVLNNFVDPAGIALKDAPGGPLVFAGRLSHEKGVDVLLEALGRVPGAELVVAGEGDRRPELELQARRVAPGRVRFVGRLPKPAVIALVREASALVLPSRWYENQPMSILEAYSCGVPVVTSDLGGMAELVEHGRTGWVVPPDDPEALAQQLGELLADPQAAFDAGRAARRWVADFSPDRHLERLGDLYLEAAGVPA